MMIILCCKVTYINTYNLVIIKKGQVYLIRWMMVIIIHAAQIGFAISMVKIIPISSVKSQN